MRRSSSICSAVMLSFAAGCGGSAPEPQEPEQVAVVELPAPPKPVALAEKAPAPEEPEEPEEPDADDDEEGGVPEEEAAKNAGILGVLKSDGGALMGPVGVFGPGSGSGVGGLGGLGLSGGGGGGTGQGFGRLGTSGGSGSGAASSKMAVGAASVTGKLPPEVIRRIVQRNLNRIRFCYEKALVTNPTLEGKVAVRFVISKDGSVASAVDGGSSTMTEKNVMACVLNVFKSMSFPAPEGGSVVIVNYPIVFAAPGPPPPPAAPPSP